MMSHRSNFLKFAVEAVRKGLRSRFALLSFYQLLGPIHRSRWTETLADCCRKSLAGCINSSMAIGLRSLFVQPLGDLVFEEVVDILKRRYSATIAERIALQL